MLIPLPMPATILPTIMCGREKALTCNIAPTAIVLVPTMIDHFRPILSPSVKATKAPKKQPMSYMLVIIARTFVFPEPCSWRVSR